ncbi:MAG: Rieske 2Fe-2S domain-containing protein [Polyangiaceae bacterium]|nr:Rieske 2Fe-2S domain-containing protein [Polyangiaceae bacterium]
MNENIAKSRRLPRAVEVRKVGAHANYWYAVRLSSNLKAGEIQDVRFWEESIALFRGEDGIARAVENRCAHRQLALTTGVVQGENITCQYHGWEYNGCGRCVSMDHELGKNRKKLPKITIRSYPVKERYGLIWIFPGDPEEAEKVEIPKVPELEGEKPWPVAPIEIEIDAHFSMIVENVCDFNHAFLHRRKQPFTQPVLNKYWREDETVHVIYDTSFHNSPLAQLFAEKKELDQIHLWYQYPYQGSNIGGRYLHWLFMLPESAEKTRCFFLFLFGPIQFPGTDIGLPNFIKKPFLEVANQLYIRPLLAEDKMALEAEQIGFAKHQDKPFYELNPIIPEFQNLTIERWKDWAQRDNP